MCLLEPGEPQHEDIYKRWSGAEAGGSYEVHVVSYELLRKEIRRVAKRSAVAWRDFPPHQHRHVAHSDAETARVIKFVSFGT